MQKMPLWLLIFCLVVSCIGSLPVSAHSPQTMTLSYDTPAQRLNVTITHQVSNPDTHYVFLVVIEKNDQEFNKIDYSSQPTDRDFMYSYSVPAEEGDTLRVIAECNQGGSFSQQLTLTAEGGSTEPSASTPGFETSVVFLSLVVFLFWIRRQ